MILCSRQHLGQRQRQRIGAIIDSGIDWEIISRRARPLGTNGFLWRHLCENSRFVIPRAVRERLEREYRFQAIVNLRLWKQLREIGQATEQAGVKVILLKGAYLAYWVYEDPALRPMSDLDLLCRERDWDVISRVMASLGYTQKRSGNEAAFFSLHPAPFFRPKSLRVDIHPNLRGASCDTYFERGLKVERNGVSFLTLGLDDLIRYLVVHQAQHYGHHFSLLWCADIHETTALFRDDYREKEQELREHARRDPNQGTDLVLCQALLAQRSGVRDGRRRIPASQYP